MRNHERYCRSLLVGERQKLRREASQIVAVEAHKVPDPEPIEDREQQQRVFGRLSERFGLFDMRACPIKGSFSIGRRIAFGMHQTVRKRDLELDLLTAQVCRTGQARNLAKRAI